jgi:hypothetical protein
MSIALLLSRLSFAKVGSGVLRSVSQKLVSRCVVKSVN